MTHDEMIAVIQAHREGKKIQVRDRVNGEPWDDLQSNESFNFVGFEYRVRPEPREWVLVPFAKSSRSEDGYLYGLRPIHDAVKFIELIHVREVIGEEATQ
jgi:hypothetical protein